MEPTKGTILVPIDGSEHSTKALDVAIDLARDLGSRLVILHVVDLARAAVLSGGQAELIQGCLLELQTEARQIVDDAVRRAASHVPVTTQIVDGTPIEQIGRVAQALRPNFIVIGTHGRSGVSRAVMGSVAEGVARHAIAPVVIVPLRDATPG